MPGVTLSGCGGVLASLEVMISGGMQSGFAPLMGTAACASTVKRTSPLAGAENVRPPAANTATLGLLAGTTSMYWAQFAPVGLPIGQLLLAVMETKPVEFTAGPAADALVFWRGIFNCRVTLPESEMLWSAARLTSTVAPPVAVFAVRKP